jgi:hypothetical protein
MGGLTMNNEKPLIRFETPAEGVRVACSCGGNEFYLAIRVQLAGALITRTAECTRCGHRESID